MIEQHRMVRGVGSEVRRCEPCITVCMAVSQKDKLSTRQAPSSSMSEYADIAASLGGLSETGLGKPLPRFLVHL